MNWYFNLLFVWFSCEFVDRSFATQNERSTNSHEHCAEGHTANL